MILRGDIAMEFIERSLESFDWKNAFTNWNPNEQVSVLKLFSLLWVTLYQMKLLVDDRDPLWITRKLKSIIQEKNLLYKKICQAFSQIQERVQLVIEDSRKYYEKLLNKLSNWNKLNGKKLNGKCYWAILKRFLTIKKFLA